MKQHVISISATNIYDTGTRRTELGYRVSCVCGRNTRRAWRDRRKAEAFGQEHLDFQKRLEGTQASILGAKASEAIRTQGGCGDRPRLPERRSAHAVSRRLHGLARVGAADGRAAVCAASLPRVRTLGHLGRDEAAVDPSAVRTCLTVTRQKRSVSE